jgi:hypothetical protein
MLKTVFVFSKKRSLIFFKRLINKRLAVKILRGMLGILILTTFVL